MGIIKDIKELFAKKDTPQDAMLTKNLSSWGNQFGLTYLGNSVNSCGQIRINQQTMYDIHKSNLTIQSYYRKITSMVAKYGVKIVDAEQNVIDGQEKYMQAINDFFNIPTFNLLKQQVFTQAFCSGQVISVVGKENLLGDKKIKILDSRGVIVNVDEYGDPISYKYNGNNSGGVATGETFTTENLMQNIIQYDQDAPYLGVSMYNGLVVDALTDAESSKLNFYFFQNKARPDMIVILNDDLLNNKEGLADFREQFLNKYQGNQNSYKPIVSSGIKDIKTLDISNNDLQLLDLRKFIDTKVALCFGIDKRLIGYNTDNGGSRAEIDAVSQINGNTKIREYAEILEDFMTSTIRKFLFESGEFDNLSILCVNDEFRNDVKDKEIWLNLVKEGVASREEFRKEFDMDVEDLPEGMRGFTMPKANTYITDEVNNAQASEQK